jgi:hypothetical protein
LESAAWYTSELTIVIPACFWRESSLPGNRLDSRQEHAGMTHYIQYATDFMDILLELTPMRLRGNDGLAQPNAFWTRF